MNWREYLGEKIGTYDPVDFAIWTAMNLGTTIDFIESIIAKHGDLEGEYASLSEIVEGLEYGLKNTFQFKKYHEEKII